MSEKKDVYSDVKSQMRLSERIAAAIPGFHGYKEKEIRRESDRLVRNHLYLKLTAAKSSLALRSASSAVNSFIYFSSIFPVPSAILICCNPELFDP